MDATITCRTPLALRAGRHQVADVGRLGGAMARRVAALSRWQDVAIDPVELRDLARSRPWRVAHSELEQAVWLRFSATHRVGQPVRGLTGTAQFDRVTEAGWLWLSLAAEVHAGSGCAAGLGQIEVFPG